MVLWSVKRSAQMTQSTTQTPPRLPLGERLVAGLNIATLAGLPLACGVFLAANRLLPLALPERADTERGLLLCHMGSGPGMGPAMPPAYGLDRGGGPGRCGVGLAARAQCLDHIRPPGHHLACRRLDLGGAGPGLFGRRGSA